MVVKRIVGLLGGIFMFVAVFFLAGAFILPHLPGALRPGIYCFGFGTNNAIGAVLGLLAGISSYRAATRQR
jgi:hypothetical protein